MSALSSGACDVQLLLDAEFYVALHRGTPHDIGYYQRVSQDAPHVLELGCGDGRVLRQLRQKAGAPQCLVGIDEHPGMLALARRGLESYGLCSCEFVQGDIRQFDLSARFERILLPYSTLWCLTDRDKLACLRCAVRHLAPGGSLHADLYVADDLLEIPDDARDTEREEELDDREFLVELGKRSNIGGIRNVQKDDVTFEDAATFFLSEGAKCRLPCRSRRRNEI